MQTIDFWRLCERLSLVQAALLLAGHDPSHFKDGFEDLTSTKQPEGYHACLAAIESALKEEKIIGKLESSQDSYDSVTYQNNHASYVEVDSLKSWLLEKGFSQHFFFFPDGVESEFLDPNHSRYAPKLAAAVLAWRALDTPESLKAKSPKQALQRWLNLNAAQFDLCDSEGKPTESAIEEISKVANWQTKGGAPSTPEKKTETKKPTKPGILYLSKPHVPPEPERSLYELDGDIPF